MWGNKYEFRNPLKQNYGHVKTLQQLLNLPMGSFADKAKYANGWIYDSSRDKKYSFASPMSVFAYMAKRGWEYKDAIIITESAGLSGKSNVWHFILMKEMPADYTPEDVIGDIDYRNK